MKNVIEKILGGTSLTFEEATSAMERIMIGEATEAQVAGFLVALRMKGEVASEVAGFASAMQDNAVVLEIDDPRAVDGCGTGGDEAGTFNISTAASLVTAGAGVTVAKHGNRSVSSKCGSADLLEVLGGNIDPGVDTVRQCINDCGFGFIFAPRFHPAMKFAAGPRRDLGVRTVFNILGPLSNPARVKRQVIGVYDRDLLPLIVDALEMAEAEHIIVAHSSDGLDEFSVAGPTGYIELRGNERQVSVITPEDVGLERHPSQDIAGGDAQRNVEILGQVLEGQKGAYRDAVVLNAAAMIYVGDKAGSIREGVALAQESLDKGQAAAVVDRWIGLSGGERN